MAKLLLIYARDNDAAKRVAQLTSPTHQKTNRFAVVGIYDFPKVADEPHPPCFGCRKGWVRDWPGGFMRCLCGGRNPKWRRFFVGALLDYLGYNLMPRQKTPRAFQNPEGHNPR